MSFYLFIRFGLVVIAFSGWILYQMFLKKKKWHDIKGDALAITFFVIAGGCIFYSLLS